MAKQDVSKKKAAYISECFQKAQQYKKDVESGKQICNAWIKLAVQRSRKDEKRTDLKYDRSAVERVFDFFFFVNINSGGKYKRFNLSPYQVWILSELFGWYYAETNKRRYRYGIIFTARKSGKTVFCVAIELYMLMYDYEEDPEAYLCATTREQAGQALKYSKAIIKNSPRLKARLKAQQFQIIYPKRSGILKVLANKPEANDSLNPYIYILDEMHAHKTLDFFNVMKSGTLSRNNPLGLITSTAGFNKDYPFYVMLEKAKRTLEGIIEDDITFLALYTLDDNDEIEDYNTWVKANPNINYTIALQSLILEYQKARLTPSELNNFITKNLNRYLDTLDQWIPDNEYYRRFVELPLPTTRTLAYAGIDLSSTRDIASLVIVWQDPDSKMIGVKPEFYFPKNEIKRIRASGIDLGEWIEKGYIIEHDTPTIDHEKILKRVAYWNTIFDIQQINYDKWNSAFIIPQIESKLYINCRHFAQQTTYFNFPLKYIEKLFYEDQICMSTNPVLRWMFRNIVLYYDGNGNIKIMKNKSKDSVDGAVALAMAVGAYLEANGDVTANFYKELMNYNQPKQSE